MAQYTFQDVALDVQPDELEIRAQLAPLWSGLFLARRTGEGAALRHKLSINLHNKSENVPPRARPLFHAGGFTVLEDGNSFYVADSSCVFHLRSDCGEGSAYLTPAFFAKPELIQYNFWTFGFLKLLQPLGFYSLHAAGLVTPDGQGMLVLGPPGSGKSTLTLGLIRSGWGYLTDDAVLLRQIGPDISAFPLRAHFYVDANATFRNTDLPLGDLVPDNDGGQRRRVKLEDSCFASRRLDKSVPELLLFSRIVPEESSVLQPLDHGTALKHLLAGSGPQLFDRSSMVQQLGVLKQLLTQAKSFELRAGLDLYHDPAILVRLLAAATAGP